MAVKKKATRKPVLKGKKKTARGFGTGYGRATKLTADAREAFFKELRKHGLISTAAKAIGVSRIRIHAVMRDDDAFKELVEEARELCWDELEHEAQRRARDGILKPVYQGGRQVGEVAEYSNDLLMFLLRGRRKKLFGNVDPKSIGTDGESVHGVIRIKGTRDSDDWDKKYRG